MNRLTFKFILLFCVILMAGCGGSVAKKSSPAANAQLVEISSNSPQNTESIYIANESSQLQAGIQLAEQDELTAADETLSTGYLLSTISPKYGNWCGADYPEDMGNADEPVDMLDAACMRHDFCYEDKGYLDCGCDQGFNKEIVSGLAQDRYQGAQLIFAHSFRTYFKGSPCSGDHSTKIAPSRALHSIIKTVSDKTVELMDVIPFKFD